MGNWCVTKEFYRETETGWDYRSGCKSEYAGEVVFCKKCKIKVRKIKKEKKETRCQTWRGTLITLWEVVTFKCPNCKTIGKERENEREEDGSFYSNSQPDG